MAKVKPAQFLAVCFLENRDTAERFMMRIQKIAKADEHIKLVDAAIADRTKKRKVQTHQTKDMGGMKGGAEGAAMGVAAGAILLRPVGALVGGAAGGVLAGVYSRFRDIGIDDKFMREIGKEVEKGGCGCSRGGSGCNRGGRGAIASLLVAGGVTTCAQLQHMSTEQLHQIIAAGGARPPASLGSWPEQAAYAARGDWNGLAAYNKRHKR
jgi:uncharacterized membrane protein